VDHHNHYAVRDCLDQSPQELLEFGLAAGKAGGITQQRIGCRGREGSGRGAVVGQHLGRGGAAAGCRDEQLARRPGEAQGIGQQSGGVLARRAADAPLQVADRPRGKPRRFGQLLLGQPGLGPQLPQQAAEVQRRGR